MSDIYLCADCGRTVESDQDAVGCDGDNCERWTHLKCNTGKEIYFSIFFLFYNVSFLTFYNYF